MRDPGVRDPIVVLSADELRALVTEAVADALAKAGPREESDVLSCDQCAELVGVHPHTVPKLVREKGLPTLRRIGKLWRFSRRDVLAWLAQRKSA